MNVIKQATGQQVNWNKKILNMSMLQIQPWNIKSL